LQINRITASRPKGRSGNKTKNKKMHTQEKTTLPNWDTDFSTYYWCIYLDKNKNKVPTMWGYSKRIGQRENTDTIALLQRIIARLYRNGYFEKMEYISIYKRTNDRIIDKSRNPVILNLYPKHYNITSLSQANHDIILKQQGKFLENFYAYIREGKDVSALVSGRRMKTHESFLNVLEQSSKIRTVGELYTHAGSCLTHGHPEGEVMHFVNKFKEMRGWK
jgi:hypothetical protein